MLKEKKNDIYGVECYNVECIFMFTTIFSIGGFEMPVSKQKNTGRKKTGTGKSTNNKKNTKSKKSNKKFTNIFFRLLYRENKRSRNKKTY